MADGMEPKASQNTVVHNQTQSPRWLSLMWQGGHTVGSLADQQLKGALLYFPSHYLHMKRCLKQRKLHFQREATLSEY